MTVENLAVWSIPPDWRNGISEFLSWQTSVLQSPLGVEQRFGLRLSPRQSFEIGYVVTKQQRTYFDLLTLRSAGSPVYLPLWHEPEKLKSTATAGATTLAVDTTNSEFETCRYVFLRGSSPFEYEVAEVSSVAASTVTLAAALAATWSAGTLVYPVKKCRVQTQPAATRQADRAAQIRARFTSLEPNRTAASNPLGTFGSQYVLEDDPNELDLDLNYSRLMFEIDNETGIPALYDVTGYSAQQFAWFAKGRAQLARLRGILYALQGRRTPIWVPTYSADFDLLKVVEIGETTMDVKRCGFTDMDGPFPGRQYVVFRLYDGQRLYRKITGSVIINGGERIAIDNGFGFALQPKTVKRISFLTLCRLDQDEIEIVHHTATKGVSTATTVFRSATAYSGLDLEQNIEIPIPGELLGPVCLNDFEWDAANPASINDIDDNSPTIDKYGNIYYSANDLINVYNLSGVLLNTYSDSDIAALIDAWYGSPFVALQDMNGFRAERPAAILNGEYVLLYLNTISGGFRHWVAVAQPAVDGSLTVLGAIWYDVFNGGSPRYLSPANLQTISDPILFLTYAFLGIHYAHIGVLPSVQDIIDGVYAAGYPGGGYSTLEIPFARFRPIGGSDALSDYLYINALIDANYNGGFVLPNSSGGTNLYCYISRAYTASPGSNVEITNVLASAHPNGCMVKVVLGDVDFESMAEAGNVPTPAYIVDNANWQESDGSAAIPFLDEYTYPSTDEVGGSDSYQMEPAAVVKRPNGKYWIVFFMPGYTDRVQNGLDRTWQNLRVFEYDPDTEIARQIFRTTCVLHNSSQVPSGDRRVDWYQGVTIMDDGEIATVRIHGWNYKTTFCTFPIPED